MKKIFTLVAMAFVAMSVNAQNESYTAVDADGNFSAEFAAIIDGDGKATNVVNGNSVVKFSTANIEVEGVSTGTPADKKDPDDPTVNLGQDLTIGASIGENMYEYTVNSTNPISWVKKNQGDIAFWYVQGTGVPAVSAYAEQIITDGEATGKYRLGYTSFDPAVGGLPVTGLYYKITTKVDGALKLGMWANKGNHPTYLVDADTKQVSEFLVEGYINGQTYTEEDVAAGKATEDQVGKKKWLNNEAIQALHDANENAKPYVIGAGNQPFWGNVIVDAKANKTYYLFQGTTQIGFQGFTFYPGKSKEELTGIESIKNVPVSTNASFYNLSGQKVNDSYKGIVIKNGKKVIK